MEPCHECLKVKQNQRNDGSICQFEGFRKVKRIRSDFQTPFAFEGASYLDPSEADLNNWTTKEEIQIDEEVDVKMVMFECKQCKEKLFGDDQLQKHIQDTGHFSCNKVGK